MTERSISPDFTTLTIPSDAWSASFWEGTASGRLLMPRCRSCGTFRWPAGPFCPACHTQPIDWVPAGAPSIYSFTILPADDAGTPRHRVPVVVTFADAPGVRLVSVLIDTVIDSVQIGAPLALAWLPAANATIPAFRLAGIEAWAASNQVAR